MNMVYKAALIIKLMDKRGGQFLKKLWCCVGGDVKQNFGFINQVDKVNCLPLRDWKLTFRALALRQSESRNCGLHLVYMESGGATLLVGTWQRGKQE